MNCQRVREIFPDLLDPRTSALGRQGPDTPRAETEARAHLAACPDCQREFAALAQTARTLDSLTTPAPSPRLRQDFYAMLEKEKHAATNVRAVSVPTASQPNPRRRLMWGWILSPLAGCALLAIGFLAGQRSAPVNPTQGPNPAVAATPGQDDSTKRELVALREQIDHQRKQLDKMTTLVGYSILQQQQNPANERLKDVLAAARSDNVNDKVLDDLIQALTFDPSANVRLRAIEALYPHAERATVRAGVLAALPREQNPLVQLELIDFVASAQDPEATPLLEQISADESANRTVRDAAMLALAHFSPISTTAP
jgi:hypothetical protein